VDQILMPLIQPMRLPPGACRPAPAGRIRRAQRRIARRRRKMRSAIV
jgi:hypothetical protein